MTETFFNNNNDGFNDIYDDNFGNFEDNYLKDCYLAKKGGQKSGHG